MPITQINDGNGLNAAGGHSIRNKSKFINKYPIGGTYRFGEYGVNFCAETVADDNHTIHLGHNVISNTLKAPLLQDVILKKDLFWVPDMCILPMNWEKFFVNPVKGEDVPNDVGCCSEHFGSDISTLFETIYEDVLSSLYDLGEEATSDQINTAFTWNLRYILLAEMIFSNGCLLSSLGCNLAGKFGTKQDEDFGKWFDTIIASLFNSETIIAWPSGESYKITPQSTASQIRMVLNMMRDDMSFYVDSTDAVMEDLQLSQIYIKEGDYPVNLRRLWAYQIVCAHFYSNDKIDYVYSAELFRQLVYSCYYDIDLIYEAAGSQMFTVNGLNYQYDFLSAHYFNYIVNAMTVNIGNEEIMVPALQYFRLLFGYNNSLRYLDYFTGSRSQPLAVGDVTVAVNNNMVNVVNIAAKTMAAKMLNVANRVGQRIESYVKEFFGIEMAKDYHNPFWLAHTADQIDNPENQNTASEQYSKTNSITSIFRTGGNSTGFQADIDRAGVLIGITYFDIQRIYSHAINKNFFHVDRYDDFLPYLQYVGDQEVNQMELDSSMSFANTYGYQGRNMEYKQMVPYCFGGFAKDLAPYVFLANEQRKLEDFDGNPYVHIGPSYIRSLPTELDRFFNILNGYSLDTYYHFAIVNNIYWEATRPMAALPGILNG